ncbi:MAG: NAD(P)/FAD-dependent oxidoreductase [Pseudonocardia sp.]|uniref:flavin-containing monooxygenase n=1 Tax=unclassified Pseudonocardia TaxID=2619320 RepID=UPI00086DB576|nr:MULTISPECIES: NAD(P)/FAD-dependent oxidoreductase [unclassified Pseudonocardia]MBN9113092.1 NAD(P)/FAD-dependent oxidoreductase [Pseudonocardia sp.]ODV05558.1 MAG: cyclohexanone monooxygenase [Pseudonocardia sp. SCN 73-27]
MAEEQTAEEQTAEEQTIDVVVVGAGFAGLYMLHRLRRLGLSAVVLEAADGVGGTWYWNRYPGARCDSESYYYSYSFDEELQQEWTWSERYAGQAEILRYLDHVADRFDLRDDIRLNTRVTAALWDDVAGTWTVGTETGGNWTARWMVTAVGCLSSANVPDIPGLESFGGDWYHTGQWPHEKVDFTGKRVGIVGTGSTGIQAIPVIAAKAEHLTVFQRTPNYSIPARNGPMPPEVSAKIKEEYGDIRAVQRASTNGHPFLISQTSALAVADDVRTATYEDAWEFGGLRFRAAYSDLLSDQAANDTASDFIRDKIREVVKDAEVAERLLPDDHGFATKRPPIDTRYFETYNRDNVTLVDVRATPIQEITATGMRTTEQEYELDCIVFATGFDALTGPLLRMNIQGRDGATLRDRWAEGPKTYLGLQVAGFPNMFTITGPGSPSVLTNMPTCIEQHVDWITDVLEYARDGGLTRIETTEAAEQEWGEEVQRAADRTLLPRASTSWYLGANVPGKPRVFMPYAGGMASYASTCTDVAKDGYRGFVMA